MYMNVAKLNGWQRLGVVFSLGWVLFVSGFVAEEYAVANTFEEALSGACPTLSGRSLVQWHDSRTGKRISIYAEGERSINCKEATDRAMSLRQQSAQGQIEPRLQIEYLSLLASIVFPILAGWILVYLVVWIFRWVKQGFKIG